MSSEEPEKTESKMSWPTAAVEIVGIIAFVVVIFICNDAWKGM